MRVRELIGGEVIWITPDESLRHAAELMKSTGVGSLAVEVDGDLEGILTDHDIVMAAADGVDFEKGKVRDWMTDYPDSFSPEMGVDDAASWMLATGYRHLPVVDGGSVVGMVSIKDVLWAITDSNG